MPRLGIDLGGTKIEGTVLDSDGRTLATQRMATPVGDYKATVGAVIALVGCLESSVGKTCSVGIGTPGSPSPETGLIRNANSTCLNGRALVEDLQQGLAREIRIANDADCFALSEAHDGAAAGAASVFGVIIGTGTGGGLVIDGRLLRGPNRIAGEWGHNPLPWPRDDERPGPPCYCGHNGCIETFLSGPGLVYDYTGGYESGQLDARTIVDRATNGERSAVVSMERYYDRMARALAAVINVIDPEVVVLGGGLSGIASLYEEVPSRWARYVFSDTVRTRLVRPLHGDSSGVRGAARLWPADASP